MAAEITTGPAPFSWTVYAGDRNREFFELTAAEDPVDITGALIEAQVRVNALAQVVALEAVVTITEPLLGRFSVEWDGEAIRALMVDVPTWSGVWDMQITEEGETKPRTLLGGPFQAVYDVTRAGVAR